MDNLPDSKKLHKILKEKYPKSEIEDLIDFLLYFNDTFQPCNYFKYNKSDMIIYLNSIKKQK